VGWSCVERPPTHRRFSSRISSLGGGVTCPGRRCRGRQDRAKSTPCHLRRVPLRLHPKDGHFYEWALYVPDISPPARGALLGYNIEARFHVDEKQFSARPMNLSEDLPITSREDFDTWVRGAMAELSDEGVAPVHATYENVMALAEELRSSARL